MRLLIVARGRFILVILVGVIAIDDMRRNEAMHNLRQDLDPDDAAEETCYQCPGSFAW